MPAESSRGLASIAAREINGRADLDGREAMRPGRLEIDYLGMQFGGVRSTSQVAKSFMGTGRVAGAVVFVRSAIFGPVGPRQHSPHLRFTAARG
ncbi:hypothetical protein KM043_010424 [Ampulex compressa]|nr:hypothetical protein KM043_010424 [Ampulex compressa]